MSNDSEVTEAEIVEPSEVTHVPVRPVPTDRGVVALRQALTGLDDQRQVMVADRDVVGLCWGSADLAAVISDLGVLNRNVRSDIATLIAEDHPPSTKRGRPKLDVEGLGRVEVPSGNERKNWESEKLLRRVVWGAVVDPDTGELLYDHPVDLVDAIITAVQATMPVSGSTSWKVGTEDKANPGTWTGLRGQGIDPDDYCETVAKPSLAVVPKLH